MIFNRISQGIKEFCENMVANPNDWVQGQFEFKNTKHPDIRIWNSNGVKYVKIGGNQGLTNAEKRHILKAINLTTARKLLEPVCTENTKETQIT